MITNDELGDELQFTNEDCSAELEGVVVQEAPLTCQHVLIKAMPELFLDMQQTLDDSSYDADTLHAYAISRDEVDAVSGILEDNFKAMMDEFPEDLGPAEEGDLQDKPYYYTKDGGMFKKSPCPEGEDITDIQECMDVAKSMEFEPVCDGSKEDCGETGWNGNIPCIKSGSYVYPYYRSQRENETVLCKRKNKDMAKLL